MIPSGFHELFSASAAVAGTLIGLLFAISVASDRMTDDDGAAGHLVAGLAVAANTDDIGSVRTIAILVVVCFLLGIARAWELIGGPPIGLARELGAIVRARVGPAAAPGPPQDGPTGERSG